MKLGECKTLQHKMQEFLGLRRHSTRITKALSTNFGMFSSSPPFLLFLLTTLRYLYQTAVKNCSLFRAAVADHCI